MSIPVFDKFKSVTSEGKLLDYDEIADIPIIRRDLTLGESLPDGYYIHIGETTQMFTNGRIYHRSGNTYDEIAPGKDALIMTKVATLGHAPDVVPEVFGTYYLSATFNREFEDDEFCFGLVTASNRDYAVIGKVFHVDDELRIQIYTLCDITSSEPLILTKGRTTTLPTAGATCFLSQESYNRDWVSGETIFGIVGYIESNTVVGRYAVVGTIYDNSPRIVVSSVASIQGEKGEKGDRGEKGDQGIQGEAGKNGIDGIDGKDAILNTTNITLTASGWTAAGIAFVQTVSVEGVTENSNVVISPYPQSMRQYTSAGVFAAYQLSDGIKFECSTKPTDSIYVNILVLRG